MTKKFLPLIRKSKGRIVNISSISGRAPCMAQSAYSVSKAAVEMFSDILRQDVRQFGVKVSILEPSAFQTDVAERAKMKNVLDEVMGNLSEETKADFDVEDYSIRFKETIDKDEIMPKKHASEDLSPVVNGITDALLSTHPRCRYQIGKGALVFVSLAHYLPSNVFDFLICSFSPEWLFIKPKQ
ncbi:17-beta-hydroxysteroid dehydrogenase type 2-like [Ptychodera flava]|uniref:17-beta-hydroxysteroid dehydrogenase type 2-like n=1 Tax=Ptychodera flava TaxID=63121 RepID=UPI00396AA38C